MTALSSYPAAAEAQPKLWHALVLTAAVATMCLFRVDLQALDLTTLSRLALLCVALLIFTVVRARPRGLWSVPSLFALVASLFHVGLLFFPAFGLPVDLGDVDVSWFYTSATREAIVLVTIGLLSYGLGVVLVGLHRSAPASPPSSGKSAEPLAVVGFFLLASAIALWIAITARAVGPGFVFASYRTYLDATNSAPMPYVLLFIGLGLVFVAASRVDKWIRRAAIVFGVFALLALPLGLRGEVLFPAVAAAAVLARSRRMPNAVNTLLVALVLLSVFSAIRQERELGLGNVDAPQLSISPLAGVGELGTTLRVTSLSVSWHEEGHEAYRVGSTYEAPFARPMSQLLGRPVAPARADYRLMNVEIKHRVGGIGGSFIGEAHHNFGAAGVLLIPFMIGYALCQLDRRRVSLIADGAIGIVMFALLQHVRNSFAPLPSELLIGFVLLVAVWIVSNRLGRPAPSGAGSARPGQRVNVSRVIA